MILLIALASLFPLAFLVVLVLGIWDFFQARRAWKAHLRAVETPPPMIPEEPYDPQAWDREIDFMLATTSRWQRYQARENGEWIEDPVRRMENGE